MKKFFAVASVIAAVGLVNAFAADRSGKAAIGFQESFTSNLNNLNNSNTLGTWSIKYGIKPNITWQFVFGFDFANKGGNNRANVGARVLYDLTEKKDSDFYTGIGMLFDIDKDNHTLRIDIPLGFEWNFTNVPEVALSAEAGFVWDYRLKEPKRSTISSMGGNVGGALGLGIHYYF